MARSKRGPAASLHLRRRSVAARREPAGLDIVEPGPTIDPLYDLPFEHGLRDQGNTERPDMIAVVGRKDGQIVSLAAASAWTEA